MGEALAQHLGPVCQPDRIKQHPCPLIELFVPVGVLPEDEPAGGPRLDRNPDVFERRQAGEYTHNLERSPDSHAGSLMNRGPRDVAPLEIYAACARREYAREHIEERRLACTIGTDEA